MKGCFKPSAAVILFSGFNSKSLSNKSYALSGKQLQTNERLFPLPLLLEEGLFLLMFLTPSPLYVLFPAVMSIKIRSPDVSSAGVPPEISWAELRPVSNPCFDSSLLRDLFGDDSMVVAPSCSCFRFPFTSTGVDLWMAQLRRDSFWHVTFRVSTFSTGDEHSKVFPAIFEKRCELNTAIHGIKHFVM